MECDVPKHFLFSFAKNMSSLGFQCSSLSGKWWAGFTVTLSFVCVCVLCVCNCSSVYCRLIESGKQFQSWWLYTFFLLSVSRDSFFELIIFTTGKLKWCMQAIHCCISFLVLPLTKFHCTYLINILYNVQGWDWYISTSL